ncbi:hypothetical protein HPP92_008384 [Vanilla planifolia]|uniref:SPX domain-containing protein n=1 Tax=Vanilla planifolia TaxID=51239 RepID=A0A835RAC0_VANPL|nr:hypothetical protein HPP92_008384 [Vanilla planifolia]
MLIIDSTVTIKMVNFGKKLMVDQIPEWKRYYINYKLMKKKVRQYAEQIKNEGKDRGHVLKEFSRMLDDQIEKMVLFLLEQQGVLASRIEKLGEQRANLAEMPDISKISELRETYREVALDLVKLLKFVDLNATDDYSLSLGAAPTVCGIIIGSMAVAQVFSSIYFSAWSNRSYFKPLIFSSIMLFLGNVMYALAYDCKSLTVLLLGRLFCGMGSARAVNRRYISDCVPLKIRMQASAGFVSASALGMACGPALAGLLQANFKLYSVSINQVTLPGWVMSLAWLIYLIWLWFSFKEPDHGITEKIDLPENTAEHAGVEGLESGIAQPLLLSSEDNENEEGEECDDSEEGSEDSHKSATSFGWVINFLRHQ